MGRQHGWLMARRGLRRSGTSESSRQAGGRRARGQSATPGRQRGWPRGRRADGPVVVVADEAVSDEGEVARLVWQWAENEHRAGLTGADKLNTIEQLALLGVGAAQIAKRTKARRKEWTWR
jgi:hypothetical protein